MENIAIGGSGENFDQSTIIIIIISGICDARRLRVSSPHKPRDPEPNASNLDMSGMPSAIMYRSKQWFMWSIESIYSIELSAGPFTHPSRVFTIITRVTRTIFVFICGFLFLFGR